MVETARELPGTRVNRVPKPTHSQSFDHTDDDFARVVWSKPRGNCQEHGNDQCREQLQNMAEVLGANTVYPVANEKIIVGSAEIEPLYVFDGKEKVDNGNGLSIIFTVTDGKRIMITGDAFKASLRRMAEEYGDDLKSDILQLPHHALCDTGVLEFYECVDAQTVILPTCIAGYRAMVENEEYAAHNVANKYAENNAHIVYKSFEGNFEIQL